MEVPNPTAGGPPSGGEKVTGPVVVLFGAEGPNANEPHQLFGAVIAGPVSVIPEDVLLLIELYSASTAVVSVELPLT